MRLDESVHRGGKVTRALQEGIKPSRDAAAFPLRVLGVKLRGENQNGIGIGNGLDRLQLPPLIVGKNTLEAL